MWPPLGGKHRNNTSGENRWQSQHACFVFAVNATLGFVCSKIKQRRMFNGGTASVSFGCARLVVLFVCFNYDHFDAPASMTNDKTGTFYVFCTDSQDFFWIKACNKLESVFSCVFAAKHPSRKDPRWGSLNKQLFWFELWSFLALLALKWFLPRMNHPAKIIYDKFTCWITWISGLPCNRNSMPLLGKRTVSDAWV